MTAPTIAGDSEDAHFCKRCGKRIGDSNYIDPDLEDRLYRANRN
jgi:hypothetical protein